MSIFACTHVPTCLLLDSKASEMLVGIRIDDSDHSAIFFSARIHCIASSRAHTRSHAYAQWIWFEHARGFLACEAFWMLVGIHADVSDHHPIFKDTIPLQSLTIPFFDSRHIQGRPAMLRTRTAASPPKPSDTIVRLFFRILRMCDPITKPVNGLMCECMHTYAHTHVLTHAQTSVHMGK